jgi:antitoxin component YwqK of YwqJK toxin-antitoxin module
MMQGCPRAGTSRNAVLTLCQRWKNIISVATARETEMTQTQRPILPTLSRIDFYKMKEDELVLALAQAILALAHAIETKAKEEPTGTLTTDHEALVAWGRLLVEVPNGGFTQFFYNFGEDGVAPAADLLDSLDVPKAGPLLREAITIYRQHQSRFEANNPCDGLFGSIKEFDKLDNAFMDVVLRANRALEKWIRGNIAELATGEGGKPIDPRFSGSVETKQPNGLVARYLEVKNGKPNGAYRAFFDDGTVRKVVFYKAGKVSADYWPNGHLKRKQSKRGPHKVIEWFYPSGKLQKHFVAYEGGHALEPVKLFHENGQLAEELTVVEGHERGPWLKFFDDGSPQLQAEYTADHELIVHNSWDENRRQIVKNGNGIFRDDGRSINWEHALFFESGWEAESELNAGIPHGKVTRYHGSVMWSITCWKSGRPDGESTTYWDNGRVRSVQSCTYGKWGESKSFPKFDRPVPAVILTVEANETLYAAWNHPPVDEYPRVLNLDVVRAKLKVPDFLRQVHERNLAKSLKSDYEECSTFEDAIGYFLTVSETGEVASAGATGSGVYSVEHWGTYPPLLKMLRFAPGRIRGRAVPCRVYARVSHTFVEGPAIGASTAGL